MDTVPTEKGEPMMNDKDPALWVRSSEAAGKKRKSASERLVNLGYEGTVILENYSYDDALIGIDSCGRAVYDFDKMVAWLMDEEGWSYDDAVEWIEYNTIRALSYAGPGAPIIMYHLEDEL